MEDRIRLWKNQENLDKKLKNELEKMDDAALEDAFYADLTFGTGGLRGITGAGTNRMNIYTVRRATLGFGKYLLKRFPDSRHKGVVIAYDGRHHSVSFSEEAASVLASLGITVYRFTDIRPTPELSFAVRYLGAIGGIMITASHNPPAYNGFKVYDEDGCQLVPRLAERVINEIEGIQNIFAFDFKPISFYITKGFIKNVGKEMDDSYLSRVKKIALKTDLPNQNIKIVFTPLHGTASVYGVTLLEACGHSVVPVKEQMVVDPDFNATKSANPEDKIAFEKAIEYGKLEKADLLMATDPDADRMGVAVLTNSGEYTLLNGNETGAIMLEYLANFKPREKRGVVFNTIVTSDLAKAITKHHQLDLIQTLTGFKYIGEQAKLLEKTDKEFFFGYEESYGYVVSDFVRDKDAFQAMLILAEAASYYKTQGKTLLDVLDSIYKTYGYYQEDLHNISLEGIAGKEKIKEIMSHFRNHFPTTIAGKPIMIVEDYEKSIRYEGETLSTITLPKENVLKFILKEGGWFVLRPSGTEPKLKIYIALRGDSKEVVDENIIKVKESILDIIHEC